MNDGEARLIIRAKGQELEYQLTGRVGYKIDEGMGTVRVWDDNSTWLTTLPELVLLHVPNRMMYKR
jgi:hypothetical protein